MKYLYPYEKEKEGLSTQEQLQTAIETNRRESRRNNYAYSTNNDNLVPRNQHNSLPQNAMQLPLSIAQTLAVQAASESHVNGHPHVPQHHPQHLTPNIATNQSKSLFFFFKDRTCLRILLVSLHCYWRKVTLLKCETENVTHFSRVTLCSLF